MAVNDVTVNESEGSLTFTLTRSGDLSGTGSVDYSLTPGTATTPADYGGDLTGTVSFAAGEATQTVTVSIVDDDIDELDEQFTINLSNGVSTTIADAQGIGTIVDDDDAPTLSVSDVTVNEGETASFTVTLTGQTDREVSVNLGTADGSAIALAAGDGDYDETTGALTFAADPAATSRTLTFDVATNDDAIDELDETFTVNLSEPANATIADGEGVGTIVDNDDAPELSISDVTVNEGETASFTVTLSGQTDREVSVDLGTADGSAIALAAGDGDYDETTGTLTFAADPAATSRTLTFDVATNDDAIDELDETFTVNLSEPANATIADGEGVGTIVDNDDAPELSISDVTVNEGETASFTVTLSGQTDREVSVDLGTADGSAIALAAGDGDYDETTGTLTFTADPAATSRTLTFDVVTNDDAIDEPDETFTVNLSEPANATIADGEGVGTIVDNDDAPELSISDVTVNEGETASFTVTLTGQTDARSPSTSAPPTGPPLPSPPVTATTTRPPAR